MKRLLERNLTPATAISCAALFMALGGGAYAAKTTLSKNAVKKQHLANGAVTTPKLRNAAVTTLKLRRGSVTTLKLRNGAVSGQKVRQGAIGTSQLASGAVRSGQLGGGVVTTAKLKNAGVTEEKLAGSAVTTSKLGSDAVSTGKLQDGAVSAAKLNSGLLAQLVKDVTYATAISLSNNTEATKTVTAECPTGKQTIGGGGKVDGGGTDLIAITESAPTPPNAEGKRTGWTAAARAETGGGGTNWSVEAYVVCAEL